MMADRLLEIGFRVVTILAASWVVLMLVLGILISAT